MKLPKERGVIFRDQKGRLRYRDPDTGEAGLVLKWVGYPNFDGMEVGFLRNPRSFAQMIDVVTYSKDMVKNFDDFKPKTYSRNRLPKSVSYV